MSGCDRLCRDIEDAVTGVLLQIPTFVPRVRPCRICGRWGGTVEGFCQVLLFSTVLIPPLLKIHSSFGSGKVG